VEIMVDIEASIIGIKNKQAGGGQMLPSFSYNGKRSVGASLNVGI